MNIDVTALLDPLQKIDFTLLREQKDYCINEADNNQETAHIYEGIVNLIDALQDAIVKSGLATACEVFGNDA